MKTACAKHAKLLFFKAKCANLRRSCHLVILVRRGVRSAFLIRKDLEIHPFVDEIAKDALSSKLMHENPENWSTLACKHTRLSVPKRNDNYDKLEIHWKTVTTNNEQWFNRNNHKMQQSCNKQNPWKNLTKNSPTPLCECARENHVSPSP